MSRPVNLGRLLARVLAGASLLSACSGGDDGSSSGSAGSSSSSSGAGTASTSAGSGGTASTSASTSAASGSSASTSMTGGTSGTSGTSGTGSSSGSGSSGGGVPGAALGTFDLTFYWVAYEGDFAGTPDTSLGTCGGSPLATVVQEFADAVALEGTGKLLDDRVLNIGGCGCMGGYDCFLEIDAMAFPWGMGSMGNALVPFLSIATDTSVLPYGTWVYAPDFDGVPLPGSAGVHDGCLRADDVGGGINGLHIDFFAATEGNYQELVGQVPAQIPLYEGGTKCG